MKTGKPDTSVAIGATGYKISLISVAPGKEPLVAEQWTRNILAEGGESPVCVLKLFGTYDICVISKSSDLLVGPSIARAIPHIRGSNHILAFPWASISSRQPLATSTVAGSVWGLLFFRLNEPLAAEFGARIETVLARAMQRLEPKVAIDVLGTTGWAELVYLVRGSGFGEVTRALSQIWQTKVQIRRGIQERTDLFSAKTFSLLGMDFPLTLPNRRAELRRECREEFRFGKDVFPVLSVTCAPGSMDAVHIHALRKIGKGAMTFGATDFVFSPDHGTWGEFVSSVLEFRRKLPNDIYSTAVNVLHATGNVGFEKVKAPKPQPRRALRVPKSLAGLSSKWGPIFESRLQNLYFGTNNLLQDPLIGDCFSDLRPTLEKRLPVLLSQESPDDDSVRTYVGEYIEVITYGAAERAHGAFLALERVGGDFSATKGGIQRVLKAASVIPTKLLSRVGMQWHGFMVAGYENQRFASWGDVINLPFHCLFRPEEWWGLFHEAGHVVLWDDELIAIDQDRRISDAIRSVAGSEFGGSQSSKWARLVHELVADSFDLYFCHRGEFRTYMRRIWRYFMEGNTAIDSQRFIRCAAMYVYWKHLLRKKSGKPHDEIDVPSEIMEFRSLLEELELPDSVSMAVTQEAETTIPALIPALQHIHLTYTKRSPLVALDKEIAAKPIKAALASVLRGQPYLSPIESPDVFVLALKQNEDKLTFSSRMAAIMSLWHTAQVSGMRARS